MSTVDHAQQLLRLGRVAEAERAYAETLEHSPNNVEALNVVALGALREGRHAFAIEMLRRAIAIDGSNPITHYHLGQAFEREANWAAAVAAYGIAVKLNENFHVARLHLANSLEHLNKLPSALLQYSRALKDAQQCGRWLDPRTTPEALRTLVEHAVVRIRGGRRELLFGLLEPLAKQYGRSELTRLEQCLQIYLGEVTAVFSDARQRPTFLYFPGLPTSPYFDRQLFGWIDRFEAYTDQIRGELLRLLPSTNGQECVFTDKAIEQQNLCGQGAPPSWTGFYFYRYGERREDNCRACPVTAMALSSIPLAQVRQHAPEVFFSVFTAGTQLLSHHGVTNTRVVAHLPLIIPSDCALSVGGEIHSWQEGRVVVFDDTYPHEAWNRSDQTRVVLIFDLWNPWLTEVERAALADIVSMIGDFRKAVDAA